MLFELEKISITILFVVRIGSCLQCYECATDIEFGSHDACSSGKSWYLRRVQCMVPSVCAAYSVTRLNQGRATITSVMRGCQAIEHGSTCEEIFNDLRSRESFPHGHHVCSTCSTDFCNASGSVIISSHVFLVNSGIIVTFIMNYRTAYLKLW